MSPKVTNRHTPTVGVRESKCTSDVRGCGKPWRLRHTHFEESSYEKV